MTSQDLLIFSKQGDLKAVSFGNFHHYMISLSDELLEKIMLKYGFVGLSRNLDSNEKVIRLHRGYFAYIQAYIQVLFYKLHSKPYLINSQTFQSKVKDRLPSLILNFYDQKAIRLMKPSQRKRDLALERCIAYISANSKKNLTIPGLSIIAGASERTLEYAFSERYGITPKAYITSVKLNDVRKALIDPLNKELITITAKRSGFNHPGQFTADYKNLFGEMPSETVRTSRAQIR